MHFLTTTTTTLLLSTLAAALPAADLTPRACSTLAPTTLLQLIQDQPTINTGNHQRFQVSQSAGRTSQFVTEIAFSGIPANAYGCTLEFVFPPGFRGLETTGPDTRLNFYSLDKDVSLADTWVSAPGKVAQVGTQSFVLDPSGGETRFRVVSATCKSVMGWRVEVEGERAGSVGFAQGSQGGAGARLTYNC